jgi:hypothetical protein
LKTKERIDEICFSDVKAHKTNSKIQIGNKLSIGTAINIYSVIHNQYHLLAMAQGRKKIEG